MRFGIVGTSWISDRFVEAGLLIEDFRVEAVYSRNIEKARSFGEKYGVNKYFDSLENMAKSQLLDGVYIASPNSLHIEQAKIFVKEGISVFIEKPIASTPQELNSLLKLAREKNVLVMEGIIPLQLPNYKSIEDNLYKIGKVRKVTGIFCQYSSKYDKWKDGIYTNAFDPKWTNGALMDIGIYPLYLITSLFGKPNKLQGATTILKDSIDGEGNLLLTYDNFTANIIYSKISNSFLKSEISGEKGSIIIDHVAQIPKVEIIYNNGEKEDISKEQKENTMYYELLDFINTYKEGKIESKINTHAKSILVQELLLEGRRKMGFSFSIDNE